ncbi:MAG: PilZ domain-containing protein [Steroidobacteraceae bacterium]|nr:PilZ domain-containing protein [Steroidobacteraceae bacterium]MCW5573840.1 PilZ domain-containing protein [Steroidobacteraceae bacterium]
MDVGSDTIVLDAELAYADVLPIRWVPLAAALDVERAAALIDQNLRVLQTFAAMEDSAQVEKPDEDSPHSADLQRIEFKVNLLLDLVGRILAREQPVPELLPIRFNARGAMWQAQGTAPEPDSHGVLEIYLRESLLQPLRMPGRVAGIDGGRRVKVDFDAVGEPVADIIEKLAFRRHRRQVAKGRSRPA